MTSKTCTQCGCEKHTEDFTKDASMEDGLNRRCKPCIKSSRNKNPSGTNEYIRYYKYSKKFGLTEDAFRGMLHAQNYQCAICSDILNVEEGKFAVDHNHSTGEVRGVLCRGCNRGLGYLRDNPTILISASKYLERQGHYAT